MASKNIKGITIEIGGDTTKLDKALAGVEKTSRSAKSELKEVEKAIAKNPDNIDLWKQKQEVLNKSLEASKDKLKILVDAQGQMNEKLKSGEISGEQYRAFQRELANTRAEVEELTKAANDCSPVLETMAVKGERLTGIGEGVAGAGEKLLGVTAGIAGVATASVAAFKELDAGYDIIITKTGATGEALESLKDSMDAVFGTLPTTAEEAGTAIGEVNTRFGLTGEELEKLSEQFIMFANINGTDLNSSIDNVDSILKKFNLDSNNAANVLGLLSKVGQDTGLSMDSLESTLMSNGTTMKEMGLGLTESINLLAQFEKTGVDSSTALAGLKKAQQNATKDGKTLDAALKEQIRTIRIANDDTYALQKAEELFGKKGAAEMTQAIREGKFSLQDLSSELVDYSDVVTDTFNETQDPFDQSTVAINNLKLAGAELGTSILTALQPTINQIVDKIKELTAKFQGLSDEEKNQILKIGAIAAAVGPVLIVIGKAIAAIGKVLTVLPKVKSGINAVKLALSANPIGLIVAAIGVLIAAFKHLWDTNEEFRNNTIECWERIKKIFTDFADAFTEKINSLGFEFSDFSEMMSAAWDAFCNILVPLFESTFTQIENVLETVTTVILGVLDIFIGIFTGDWDKAWDGVKDIFEAMWNGLYKFLQNILDTINKYFGKQFETIKTTISVVLTAISSTFKSIWSGIVQTIKNAVNDIITHVNNIKTGLNMVIDFVKQSFTSAWSNAWDNVKNIFRNVFNGLADIAKAPFNSIIGMINGVLNGINGMVDGLNSIHFEIPNWVPSIGGKSFGMNLSHVGNIPYLAKGGTVSEGNQAIVGEAGAELLTVMNGRAIVQPLTNNNTTNNSSTNSYTTIINVDKIANDMDIRTLGEKLAYEQSRYNKAVGMA